MLALQGGGRGQDTLSECNAYQMKMEDSWLFWAEKGFQNDFS